MKDLVEQAEAVAHKAYAPYSRYLVGAVVRTTDGHEFVGVNVENAAYPLGVCAEKTALSAAATAGYRPGEIAAIGITASPCGGCRQWLYEWRIPEVGYRRVDGSIGTAAAADLLPDTWELPTGVGSTEPAESGGAGVHGTGATGVGSTEAAESGGAGVHGTGATGVGSTEPAESGGAGVHGTGAET